jgi:nitrate/nitrite transporter NarK
LLVAFLLNHLPWRAVFVLFGFIGLIWAFIWSRWFRDEPADHPDVSLAEAEWIAQGRAPAADKLPSIAKAALRSPSVWFLCVMYFTQTYGFYFFVTWFPTYLQREKKLEGMLLSFMAGAPLLFSVLGDFLGGLLTDRLARGYGLRVGRCLVGGLSLALASLFLVAGTLMPIGWIAGILIAFAGMFSNFLLGASWGACLDIAGPRAGSIGAAMNTAGQIGGILSPIVFSLLTRDQSSWALPLLVIAALYLLGALSWSFVHPEQPLIQT